MFEQLLAVGAAWVLHFLQTDEGQAVLAEVEREVHQNLGDIDLSGAPSQDLENAATARNSPTGQAQPITDWRKQSSAEGITE